MPTPPLSPANELGDIESSVSVNASEAMITEAAGRKVSPSEPTHTPPSTPATKQTLAVLGVTLAMLLAPALVESGRPEVARGAAVLGVMALWWVTEVLPLPITSLLPMVLYPLLGVCSASELSKVFFDATSMLFVAGFLVGLAVERWGMHRRIAFSVVALVGGGGMAALIAGFMGSTWLLSMMISNTATTLAMLPVADAFLASLPPGTERFQSGFLLAIGYAATIGGIATPVGTPTNAIFLSQYSLFWPDEPEFSFATFTLAALPLSGCSSSRGSRYVYASSGAPARPSRSTTCGPSRARATRWARGRTRSWCFAQTSAPSSCSGLRRRGGSRTSRPRSTRVQSGWQ